MGREVAGVLNEILGAGSHRIVFDASALPSGLYFYRLDAEGFTATKKMLLLR